PRSGLVQQLNRENNSVVKHGYFPSIMIFNLS
ncbi:MAG: hypothetical protein ACI89T_002063, partial [Cognaticolwellia sp.]